MSNISKGSVIIKDDFENILIIQKKSKKNEPKLWSFIGCDIKEKAVPENAILKEINKQLKVTIFELDLIKEVDVNESKKFIFNGIIRESIVTHNDIAKVQWIKKDKVNLYEFREEDQDIVELLTK
ncbi:MAG: hypothetical protein ACRC2K_12410 [Clostridium sp.]